MTHIPCNNDDASLFLFFLEKKRKRLASFISVCRLCVIHVYDIHSLPSLQKMCVFFHIYEKKKKSCSIHFCVQIICHSYLSRTYSAIIAEKRFFAISTPSLFSNNLTCKEGIQVCRVCEYKFSAVYSLIYLFYCMALYLNSHTLHTYQIYISLSLQWYIRLIYVLYIRLI